MCGVGAGGGGTLSWLHKESVARERGGRVAKGSAGQGHSMDSQSRRSFHNQIAAIVTNAIKSGVSCERSRGRSSRSRSRSGGGSQW